MSPQTKTPSTFVAHRSSRATFPRSLKSTSELLEHPLRSGPTNPIASSTSSAGSSKSVPSIFSNTGRPSTICCSTWCPTTAPGPRPCSSPRKHSVFTAKTRSPPSSCAVVVRLHERPGGPGVRLGSAVRRPGHRLKHSH